MKEAARRQCLVRERERMAGGVNWERFKDQCTRTTPPSFSQRNPVLFSSQSPQNAEIGAKISAILRKKGGKRLHFFPQFRPQNGRISAIFAEIFTLVTD
jgi:hypothetical protein